MTLSDQDIDKVAHRVLELLNDSTPAVVRLVDAVTLARALDVERVWVYEHAHQLGAVRLGGPRGRLRFDLDHTLHALKPPPDPEPAPGRPARRRVQRQSGIHGLELIAYES